MLNKIFFNSKFTLLSFYLSRNKEVACLTFELKNKWTDPSFDGA